MTRADHLMLAPLVAVILFLALYPQFVLERSETATVQKLGPILPAADTAEKGGPAGGRPVLEEGEMAPPADGGHFEEEQPIP